MYPHSKDHPFRARTVELSREQNALQIQVHSPAELQPFSESLQGWMRVVGYSRKDIFAVRLALQEAVNNAFRYGNRSDVKKRIYVRYLLTVAEVLLEVEDQGSGFDPDQVPDPLSEAFLDRPGGRGLFLMRTYMT